MEGQHLIRYHSRCHVPALIRPNQYVHSERLRFGKPTFDMNDEAAGCLISRAINCAVCHRGNSNSEGPLATTAWRALPGCRATEGDVIATGIVLNDGGVPTVEHLVGGRRDGNADVIRTACNHWRLVIRKN